MQKPNSSIDTIDKGGDLNIREFRRMTAWQCDMIEEIEGYNDFLPLIDLLEEASVGDILIINIGSPGGNVDTGNLIIRAIRNSKAEVYARIVLPSASMAAVIACACKGIIFCDHTLLMFHAYSGGGWGKADDLVQHIHYQHRYVMDGMSKTITPFLTKKELSSLEAGKDIYITADDASLPARIKRHFKGFDYDAALGL